MTWNGYGDTDGAHLILQPGTMSGSEAGAWFTSSQPVNAVGMPVTMAPPACASANNFLPCLQNHGVRLAVTYQPASRYWAFQWLETAIYLVLATGLGWLCVWQVRRKRP
jgi:hypothetical protein